MDSKLIFTVENPEDLYIIGCFPWSTTLEQLISKEFGPERIVGITDDYHPVYVMGDAKTKPSNSCETEGSFLLLTKSEWEEVREMFSNDMYFVFDELPDEEYAICIHDYIGPVKVDLINDDGKSILPEYDHKKEILYQDSRISDEYCMPTVLLKSGFKISLKYIQELHGFIRKTNTKYEDVYINYDTNQEYIGDYSLLPEGKWTLIGDRKTVTRKWLKQ